MPQSNLFVLAFDEPGLAKAAANRIKKSSNFSEALSVHDWDLPQRSVFLLSDNRREIFAAALAVRSPSKSASLRTRVRFSELLEFNGRFDWSQLREAVGSQNLALWPNLAETKGGALPGQVWDELIRYVRGLDSIAADHLLLLHSLTKIVDDPIPGRAGEVYFMERDATGLALDIGGFEKGEVLPAAKMRGSGDSVEPFLRGFDRLYAIEDGILGHDAHIFGDWKFKETVPAASLVVRLEKEGKRLTIINANRNRLEHNTGVDLIYYFQQRKSFVLIQYKMMRGSGKYAVYYPNSDSELGDELSTMRRLDERIVATSPDSRAAKPLRMLRSAFFIKVCTPFQPKDATSQSLAQGLYFSLDHWDDFMSQRTGKGISWSNVDQRISNTLFVDLCQAGWVGSPPAAHDFLSETMERLLHRGHSVTLAHES